MSPAALLPQSATSKEQTQKENGLLSQGSVLEAEGLNIESLERLYASGAITPVDVVQFVYRKIQSYHDKAVWITLVPEGEALKAAEEIVRKYHGEAKRPSLYGIPFSVKDSIDIAGLPTTLACPSYAYTATQTAPVVQRILEAGGILIGKTNLDQFATGLNGTRSPYGAPRCVYDADYVSGGSSSGSVVSVAANMVSFTVATDTAGSTRVPSAFNGVVGLKPTLGTISTVGLVPACKTADCITIIARSVCSTRRALRVMRAYDEDDVFARDSVQLACLRSQPSWWDVRREDKICYAFPPPATMSEALSASYYRLFSNVADKLSSLDFMNGERTIDYSPFASANAMLYGSSIVAQRIVAFKPYLDSHGMDELHPVIRDIFTASTGFDAVQAYEDIFSLAKYKREAARQFRPPAASLEDVGIDVLIVPSTATHPTVSEILADPIDLNKRLGSFTHFVNLLDLCAVAVPVGGTWTSANGKLMPFSITLISTPGHDEDLLELAEKLMRVDWTARAPPKASR